MRKERFMAAEQRSNEALSKEVERITTGPGGDEDAPPVKKVRFEGDEQFGVSPESSSQSSSSSAAGPVPMETGSKESRKQPEEPEEDDRAVKEARKDGPEEDQVMEAILAERVRIVAQLSQHTDTPVCEEDPRICLVDAGADECVYVDDVHGGELPKEGVEAARREEIEVIRKMKVWEVVDRPKDKKVISTRWVDTNKGDREHPNLRSRLVARELRVNTLGDFFAAMPPLDGIKALLTLAVTQTAPDASGQPVRRSRTQRLRLVDVKRAHFCAPAAREVYVELPSEAGEPQDKVGRLLKSMYGCRDAGLNWEREVCNAMESFGYVQGKSSPCVYWHPQHDVRAIVHGDDFLCLGERRSLDMLCSQLRTRWEIVV